VFKGFKKKKKIGCPSCYDDNIISFGFDYLDSKFDSKISLRKTIGETEIFQCSTCKNYFFIDNNLYSKVIPGQIEILENWSSRNLICPIDLKKEIEKIGPTENWSSGKFIPCKIELKNANEYDFATIEFSNRPPLGFHYSTYKNIFFIDEVKSISQTEYGLSYEIRQASFRATEKRMGFYPTVLRTETFTEVVINGVELFFESDKIKGKELTLANTEWDYRKNYIYNKFDKPKTIVISKSI